jgi:modulator of FtsH protease HflC
VAPASKDSKPRRGRLRGALVGVGLLAAATLASSLYIVDQTEQAVITMFGNPTRVIVNPIREDSELLGRLRSYYESLGIEYSKGPGLRIKWPFIENVNRFDRRLLAWDGYPEQIPTKDKKFIWADVTSRWCIYDPLRFLQTVRAEETALARLDDITDSVVRDHISNHDLVESVRNSNRQMEFSEGELAQAFEETEIRKGREAITRDILLRTEEQCRDFGIEVRDLRVKGINYVETVQEKVFDRMIAERQRVAAMYRSEGQGEAQKIGGQKELELRTIMSTAYREAETKRGEGDAKATEIYATAYNKDPEFYQFSRTLGLYEDALDSTTTLVLGTGNPLFQYLKDPSPAPRGR